MIALARFLKTRYGGYLHRDRRRGIRVGFGALHGGFRDFGQRTTAVIRFSLTEIMP
jgi:hypothetical protein